MRHFIVYSSPSGSTRHIAEVIRNRLVRRERSVSIWDLGKTTDRENLAGSLLDRDGPLCLWIGSPVYVDHAVPPVEDFLGNLLRLQDGYGVPFVTWGGVSSGVALLEMGQKIIEKGLTLLGGAKILALHSSMWSCQNPLGAGHPAPEDEETVEHLVDQVLAKLSMEAKTPLPLSALDYLPIELKNAAAGKNISQVKKMHPEFAFDMDKCTRCGACEETCPANAISLDPNPRFGEDCFACWACVRTCPEDAIVLDLSSIEGHLWSMARKNDEKPLTQIFF